MKLSAKYNRVNLATAIIVILITGGIYYEAISWILTNQKDKDLVVEEQEIFEYVKLNHQLPQTFQSNDQQITFTQAPAATVSREFINTEYFKKWEHQPGRRNHHHRHDGEYEAGRGLITSVKVGDKFYKILIVESIVETEDLIRLIFAITLGVILFLILVLILINRLILTRLWQPFYTMMEELRQFNIADNKEVVKLKTDIDEFNELNNGFIGMAAKAKNDYKDLKVFTENASHELLTPIAVINSKLDTLIQTENFSERQSKLLSDLYSAVSRLNRLNQSLLLLVKIENRLLQERQHIDLRLLVEETIVQFEEIFEDKKLKVNAKLETAAIFASRYLVDILLNNLISNAIRHNCQGGAIIINLDEERLVIKNTGVQIALEDNKIFTRFHKASGSEGSGLGLTISKQICENFNYKLQYKFEENFHTFTVGFNASST